MNRFELICYIIQLNDAELFATEYGTNIFSFLNSDFHNCPKK